MSEGTYGDYYTGVGARKTPNDVLGNMTNIANNMEVEGLILRSGHAPGADMAFETGVELSRNMEIYLPWERFNHAPKNDSYISLDNIPDHIVAEAINMAKAVIPHWDNCSVAHRRLHTRNVFQVLGRNLETPSNFVVCWTPKALAGGGTGTAIRIAKQESIPVFDLASERNQEAFMEYLCIKELD